MMKKIIFAVEDEENIRELYKYALTEYEVHTFLDGVSFYEKLLELSPDLILLDIMLPGEGGYEIMSFLKSDIRYREIPVLMVSAKGDELSKVKFLNEGAEDYITKPFGVMELNARINVALRKNKKSTLAIADLVLNENEHSIRIGLKRVAVTLKEYQLIKYLLENAGKTVLRDTLLEEIWGINFEGESRTLDMHIKMVREKIDGSGAEIITQRGVGYMLQVKGKE